MKNRDTRQRPNFAEQSASGGPRGGVLRAVLLIMLTCVGFVACRSSASVADTATAPTTVERKSPETGRQHVLTLYGYNYTDRYMDDLSVNGESAGNVDPSGPGGGGGSGVCCIGWTDGTPLPQQMQVEWTVGDCFKTVTNSVGETSRVLDQRSEKATAMLRGPIPSDPHYFEIHVYPDHHVEVAVTHTWSAPRLKLDHARLRRDYPDCSKS